MQSRPGVRSFVSRITEETQHAAAPHRVWQGGLRGAQQDDYALYITLAGLHQDPQALLAQHIHK